MMGVFEVIFVAFCVKKLSVGRVKFSLFDSLLQHEGCPCPGH